MSKWIRWWGLGLFVALVLIIWLGTNPLIKRSIEFVGTQAVGAKVELDSVAFRWGGPALELDRLQVTDPNAPMKNMLEAGRIEFALDGFALLRRQFVADNMAVEQLRFNTERSSSGAIGGRLFSRERRGVDEDKDFDITELLPGLSIPDTDALVAESRERLEADIGAIDDEADAISDGWSEHIQSLPDDDTVDGYRQRAREIRRLDPLRQAAAVRELRNDINDDLDNVSSLRDRLDSDRDTLSELSRSARALPREEANRQLAAVGLDDGLEGFTRQLLGAQLTGWVDRGLGAYQLASEHLAGGESEEPARPPRGEGEYIRFPEDEPLPRFLIRRAALDGIAELAGQAINFSGSISNITNEPAILGRPMTLEIDGDNEAGTTLAVRGNFDHRDSPARDELTFSLAQLPLNNASISDSSRLPIMLDTGLANIEGNLIVTGGELDANVNTRVRQAGFSAGSEDSGDILQRISRAIEGVSDFRIDLGLSGTLRSPRINIDSNLDNIIGDALGDEVRQEMAAARAELEEKLRAEVGPQLDALAQKEQALDSYREEIDARRQALRDLRP